MKKLVIFDLDGTLVNSIYDLGDSVNYALRQNSLKENTIEDYYTFVGHGMENLIRRSLGEYGGDDELYRRVRATFDPYYAQHSNDKTCAYDGVSTLLEKLKGVGIDTAVLSNKAHVFMDDIVKKCFPGYAFCAVWGNREGVARKPDPEAVNLMLSELGVSRDDCVYVGDSEVDVLTAQNAGVDYVCVTWGFRSRQTLVNAGAKIIVDTADELYDAIVGM